MATDYDKEIHIIQDIQEVEESDVLILSDDGGTDEYRETASIIDKIIDKEYFKLHWVDNSGKNLLPPDFLNDDDGLMMEVMRFDDHSKNGKKNPAREKESRMYNEIKSLFPGHERLVINAVTNLPTDEDHNYEFYYGGFKRALTKHLKKLPKYRENHPGKKAIFLMCDESSGTYFEKSSNGHGRLHVFFLDKRFLDIFFGCDLDYLIWYAPYKYFYTFEKHKNFPQIVIFDIRGFANNKKIVPLVFNSSKMLSTEK